MSLGDCWSVVPEEDAPAPPDNPPGFGSVPGVPVPGAVAPGMPAGVAVVGGGGGGDAMG
jgi:hypothetical protein